LFERSRSRERAREQRRDRKVGRWVLLVEAHLSIDHADEDHLTLGTQRMYVSINDRNDAGSIKVGIGPARCDLLDGLSQVNRERGKFGCVDNMRSSEFSCECQSNLRSSHANDGLRSSCFGSLNAILATWPLILHSGPSTMRADMPTAPSPNICRSSISNSL
jgi:hypothetical protein